MSIFVLMDKGNIISLHEKEEDVKFLIEKLPNIENFNLSYVGLELNQLPQSIENVECEICGKNIPLSDMKIAENKLICKKHWVVGEGSVGNCIVG